MFCSCSVSFLHFLDAGFACLVIEKRSEDSAVEVQQFFQRRSLAPGHRQHGWLCSLASLTPAHCTFFVGLKV